MRISFLISLGLLLSLQASVSTSNKQSLAIARPAEHARFSLAILANDATLKQEALRVNELLLRTALFDVRLIHTPLSPSKKDIIAYLHQGYSAVLFLKDDDAQFSWHLYDTGHAEPLLAKKVKRGPVEVVSRLVADSLYTYLFNKPSSLLSKIAYIKKCPTAVHKRRTELCLLDPFTGASTTLLHDNRTLVAPQWARSYAHEQYKPYLYVSECTPSNVRLLGVDLSGSVWSVLDAEGTFVGIAQRDVSTYVYARSGSLWLYAWDAATKKGSHNRLTSSNFLCACPCLTSSGDIIYVRNGTIYRYTIVTDTHTPLSLSGTCVSPDVHKRTDRLLFSRAVQGVIQVHTADLQGNNVMQLTFSAGNKTDACWSPCGNYIAYVHSQGSREQIALYNLITGTEAKLTPETEKCGYPAWSEDSLFLYR